jgi:prepilin-type N-terminal cleavage/methylation domain-containing protein
MMRSQRGFTLIELIIVVAIFGVLAAIATPSFRQMQQRALYRQAAFDVSSMLREARGRTVGENREHRVEFLNTGQYQVTRGDRSSGSTDAGWTPVAGLGPVTPPAGVTITPVGCNPGVLPILANVDFNGNGTAGIGCTINIRDAAAVNRFSVTVTQNTGRIRVAAL